MYNFTFDEIVKMRGFILLGRTINMIESEFPYHAIFDANDTVALNKYNQERQEHLKRLKALFVALN